MNWLNENTPEWKAIVYRIESGECMPVWYIRSLYKVSKENEDKLQIIINKYLK